MKESLIFQKSKPGRQGVSLPSCDVPKVDLGSFFGQDNLRQTELDLPEVGEVEVVRHFTKLSQQNHGVDSGFYPLGSCTMKYNPKVNENMGRLPGFSRIHPYMDESMVQGALQLIYEIDQYLSEIGGMARTSMQPAAGAHGELTGLMIIQKYHRDRGDFKRSKVIVPDSAHGTNPATAAVLGMEVVEVKSNQAGGVDLAALKDAVSDETAALMLTNPNTLGLFDVNIKEIADVVHQAGGLLYYDGANMNAIMGVSRPGDMGFDVLHYNLHKTFSTPHGGGGPGAGPVGVKDFLVPYLPCPMVEYDEAKDKYYLDYDRPQSIGRVKAFYGNFGIVVRAYTYIRALGGEGLKEVSENAVLNANYLMRQLEKDFYLPYTSTCMHEFILTPKPYKEQGVHTLDVAKRLIDFGFHPPTIYFPLIVEEAMMFEPTETESKETLDHFIAAMKNIAQECKNTPQIVKEAPHTTYVSRMDEVTAARKPDLKWSKEV